MTNPIALKKLHNPTAEDLVFQYGGAEYRVQAGKSNDFVDYIAVHGAKKLADKNAKSTNPDERKVLMNAYLNNITVEASAKTLGVKLDIILAKAVEKGKEKARMNNLESQVQDLTKKTETLMELLAKEREAKKVKKEDK